MNSWLRSLIDGFACIGSFGSVCGERRVPMSDAEAIASDWRAVGDDLRAALDAFEQEERPADSKGSLEQKTAELRHIR